MLVTLIIVWVKLDNAISAANKLFSELREQVEENTKDISKLDKRVVRVETFCQAQHHFHMGETPKEVEG